MYPVTPHAPDSGIEDAVVLGVLQGVRQVLALAGAGPDQGGTRLTVRGTPLTVRGTWLTVSGKRLTVRGTRLTVKGEYVLCSGVVRMGKKG